MLSAMFGWRPARSRLALVLVVVATLVPLNTAAAFDRTNVPLKNWGGFSEYRDAAYDDLERLVTAGLADRTLLNTKPLNRIEAARVVARAIDRIRRDEPEGLNMRRDLEPVLDRLMEEFKVELASLGIQVPDGVSPPGAFSFTPIDRAQAFNGLATHGFSLVNEQGSSVKRTFNMGLTFESRAQLWDYVTLYIQPELLANQDYTAARLITGYLKLTFWNIELLVGRDSLQWGPGYRNFMIFSNNAAPLDQVRLGSAEPFLLPWIGEWVGPMKALIFLGQLEERRDHKYAKISGMRVTASPATWLELGASRAVLFDGCCPYLSASKYLSAIFNPSFGDDANQHPENRTDNVFSVDADMRFRNVDHYYFPSRDLRLYGEFYWDDTCGECGPSSGIGHFLASNLLPKGSTVGAVGGVHLIGLFGQDWLEARFEYARTSPQSYNNDQFMSGYWTRGHVIGDFIGTNGRDYFARVSARITPDLMFGVNFDRAIIGNTAFNSPSPQEERLGGSLDVSYRFADRFSVFAQYLVSDVKNRNFRAGDSGIDQLLRVQFTASFR
jgi:hypothetical protein